MSLSEAIKQQIALLSELKQLLDNELQLIATRDAEALLKVVHSKQCVLDAIQQQDAQLDGMYQQRDAGSDASSEQQAELDGLAEQAKTLLEDCKYRTNINAKAVEQGQLRLEHLRKIILETRNKESMTYDNKGKAQAGNKLNSIKA